jgi:hypothetical protein
MVDFYIGKQGSEGIFGGKISVLGFADSGFIGAEKKLGAEE